MSGEVEIDCAYFGGYIKLGNRKKDRIERRRKEHQTGKRLAVVVMRERNGRTIPHVFKSEDDSVPTIKDRVLPGSTVYADEASVWDELHSVFDTKRVNHSVCFMDEVTKPSDFSPAFAAWKSVCTNTLAANTYAPMPLRPLGLRTTARKTTVRST